MAISKLRGKWRPVRSGLTRCVCRRPVWAQRPCSRSHGDVLAAAFDPAKFFSHCVVGRVDGVDRAAADLRSGRLCGLLPCSGCWLGVRHRRAAPVMIPSRCARSTRAWLRPPRSRRQPRGAGRVRIPPATHIRCVPCLCRRWELVAVDDVRGSLQMAQLAASRPAASHHRALDASVVPVFRTPCAMARLESAADCRPGWVQPAICPQGPRAGDN